MVLKLVAGIRAELPRTGTAKLHYMLTDPFASHGIKLGRDGLYELLDRHGMLIRRHKRKAYTTDSDHPYRKYPNLIRELSLSGPGQLWVSDITYLRLREGFCYLSIITDAYSHKIVGYRLQQGLHAEGPLQALAMAIRANALKDSDSLIHHSDRGVQYCCGDYVDQLKIHGVSISMTENGDPYENAVAERVNGILKDELELDQTFENYASAGQAVERAVSRYNGIRPHSSCDYLTPDEAHGCRGELRKRWRKPERTAPKQTVAAAEKVMEETGAAQAACGAVSVLST